MRDLKSQIRSAQLKAATAVNTELILLYWKLGKSIVERQEKAGWGDAVLERLSQDLAREFPEMKGFSQRNLYRMRLFYLSYRDNSEILPQLVAKIPWGHNLVILEQINNPTEREWYARKTLENGWSRAVLVHQIELELYARQAVAKKSHNFDKTLPPPDSDLVAETLKDEYIFDFLALGDDYKERDLERGLVNKIRDFLLELGKGFAFLGAQYRLEVGGQDFYLDLLFYHIYLRRLITFDLKLHDFTPEDAGKMNFYLAVLDDLVKAPDDLPSIGIILCKGKNSVVAEYSLRDMNTPIGVASYKMKRELPADVLKALPAPEEFEKLLYEDGTLTKDEIDNA